MESDKSGHVTDACKQAVSRGKSLNTTHIRRQLGISEAETIGQQSCLAVKERVIS